MGMHYGRWIVWRPVRRDAVFSLTLPTERRPALPFGRVGEIGLAIALLIFLAPLMLLVALAIALQGRGPVFYAHERVGRAGRRFKVLKFRSMAADGDRILAEHLAAHPEAAEEWARDHKLTRDPRVTPLGRLLRESSLDELPQLINILRGEMSFVGPRPIVDAELVRYGRSIRHYYAVKPGVTGLWQVSGRNNLTYRRRVALDVTYSRRKSAALDLRIIAATAPAVLRRTGAR